MRLVTAIFGWGGGKSLVSGAGRIIPLGGTQSGGLDSQKMEMTAVLTPMELEAGLMCIASTSISSYVKENTNLKDHKQNI